MAQNPLSDAQLASLVREAQEGSAEAFGKVYEHFFDAVYRYCAFHLPPEAAEDTVADIFVRAWENLHRYVSRRDIPFGAWLFRIARHKVIDVYRARRDTGEVPEHLEDRDPLNRADAAYILRQRVSAVRHGLEQLPQRYRDVLLLSFMADLPHREIARTLKLTEGGVRILKMRALRKLESLLPPDMCSLA